MPGVESGKQRLELINAKALRGFEGSELAVLRLGPIAFAVPVRLLVDDFSAHLSLCDLHHNFLVSAIGLVWMPERPIAHGTRPVRFHSRTVRSPALASNSSGPGP